MHEALVGEKDSQEIPEQRLWQAVLVTAVREWLSGPMRRRLEAERYLFHDERDFRTVCESAGMDPRQLRERLNRLRKMDATPEADNAQN